MILERTKSISIARYNVHSAVLKAMPFLFAAVAVSSFALPVLAAPPEKVLDIPKPVNNQPDVDGMSAKCKAIYASLDTITKIAENPELEKQIKMCSYYGIDPPIKTRNNAGYSPSSSVPDARVSKSSCPPFGSCLSSYSASKSNQPSVTDEVSRGIASGGSGFVVEPLSSLSAPQFTGPEPDEWPAHLQGGGLIWFYDSVSVTPPDTSLVYSDTIENYYSDGGATNVSDTYVASPPPTDPNNILTSQPVTLNSDSVFNFVDGGVVVLPPGFSGVINGTPVKGGDVIVIKHAGDMKMPAGTKLYPYPEGSLGSLSTHYTWDGFQPYSGPPINYNVPGTTLTIGNNLPTCDTQCAEPVPGVSWF